MNYKQDIRDFVISNFLFGDATPLDDGASFLDAGIVDSAGILELVSFLEERYGIRVGNDEMLPDNLDSVNRVDAFLRKKLTDCAISQA
jgi:acyl carrier protein